MKTLECKVCGAPINDDLSRGLITCVFCNSKLVLTQTEIKNIEDNYKLGVHKKKIFTKDNGIEDNGIQELIKHLPDIQQRILQMRFGRTNKTFSYALIAKKLGISKKEVQDLESHALQNIKRKNY
tara:strand:- start:371 stop:745 length:375 start_codon:yes stop_codon:yes gene_type:complete